jgi:leucine dehydrogenase
MGMKAAAKFKYGSDALENKRIIVQGIGHVGESLVEHLTNEGANVIITDINQARLETVKAKYGAEIYTGENLYGIEADIYAPCALGATINNDTINLLNVDIIAGAANNQLENEEEHGKILLDKGIVYAPDFVINSGGIINVYAELEGYEKEEIKHKTENIYNTTLEVLKNSEIEGITPHAASLAIAVNKIAERKKENSK